MATSLADRFGENAEIKAGKSGQFDVVVDGRLIFSKAQSGRFPLDNEVEEIFEALRDGRPLPAAEDKAKAAKPKPEGFVNRILGKLRN